MKESVIQFGEGNFLRGFADWFINGLREKGLFDGKVVIVQPIERGLTDIINQQDGVYNLFLRGIKNGEPTVEHTRVTAVSRAINPYSDFDAYLELAHNSDMRFIISNTTEAGIAYDPDCQFGDKPQSSFPGKLTRLLFERFSAGLPGFIILSCELIDNNGKELQSCVHRYARQWGLSEEFEKWLDEENSFCNTLVDRIVTGYTKEEAEKLCKELGEEDRLLDTAEIFHLWVIEGNFEDELPLQKAGYNVVWTDDVAPYKKRKVRILNGSHTSIVCAALLCGLETVGESVNDEIVGAYLKECLYNEIVPTLGGSDDTVKFANAVMERFANPYIRHLLRSIALNSVSKYSVRVLPTVMEYKEKFNEWPKGLTFALAALIRFYKTDEPSDLEENISAIKNADIDDILSNNALWGADLTEMAEPVKTAYEKIEQDGARKAVEWILSE